MKLFLSYGREDIQAAHKLYSEISAFGHDVWFDKKSLLAGQLWESAALKAIRDCDFFLALLSTRSVSRKGFVNREIRSALELLDEQPEDRPFLIPIRLDNCTPSHQRLAMLHRVDMFPSWNDGLQEILKVLGIRQPTRNLRSQLSHSDLIEEALDDKNTRAILDVLFYRTRPFIRDEPEQASKSLPVGLEYDQVVESILAGGFNLPTDSIYAVLNRLVSNGLLLARYEGGDGQEEPLRVWVALGNDLRAALLIASQ
jgi:hypothetical protein